MRQRVVTALLLAVPALLALALRSPYPLAALGLIAAALGGNEGDRLFKTWGQVMIAAALSFGLLALPLLGRPGDPALLTPAFYVAATLFGIAGAGATERVPYLPVFRGFAGLWIAAPLAAILALHHSAAGVGAFCLSPALMALLPVWAGDIAAIFAGKAFGKRPLAPKISPKKTVEGSVASLLASVVASLALGAILGLPLVRALDAGILVGVLGQGGDLFESWLKRRAGVKDSGTLLPGHGGVLDRIDSVLFAAPAVALVLLG